MNFDGYVKVFVVEDIDYDIVLNFFVYNFFVFCLVLRLFMMLLV